MELCSSRIISLEPEPSSIVYSIYIYIYGSAHCAIHRRAAALCWFPPDSAVAIAADSIDPWLIAYTASLLLLLFLLLLHTSVTGLKNFTGDSRYDFCCCAVSSTHCYLQCLLRALSWVVAHPDTSATHRSSESSSSSSSSSSVVTSVYNT